MLHKVIAHGKTLGTSRPLLIKAKDGYSRPKLDFKTTTTVWHVDELIRRSVRDWRRLSGETGHTGQRAEVFREDHDSFYTGTYSVFPIPLMEWIILRFGGEPGTKILDAFAGGPPRAIASAIMGYEYHGVEIRQQQIDENLGVIEALHLKGANYHLGDARTMDLLLYKDHAESFDAAITCPPYFDLEVYSDDPKDISGFKTYREFNAAMACAAFAHWPLMKPGAFVCIVVGNIRDKRTSELIDFRGDTINNFREAGFFFHQDIILKKNFASAAKRASNAWKGKKLVPTHEYLLVFRKPQTRVKLGHAEAKD